MKKEKQSFNPCEKPFQLETDTDLDVFIHFTNNSADSSQQYQQSENISGFSGESDTSGNNSTSSREANYVAEDDSTKDEEQIEKPSEDEEFGQIPIRPRQRFTQREIDILEKVYKEHKRPSNEIKHELMNACNTTLERIQVWYQNRRAKERKSRPKYGNTYTDAHTTNSNVSNNEKLSNIDDNIVMADGSDSKKRRRPSIERLTSTKATQYSKAKKAPQSYKKPDSFDFEGQIQLIEPSSGINDMINCPQYPLLHSSYYPDNLFDCNRMQGLFCSYNMSFTDESISNAFYSLNFSNPGIFPYTSSMQPLMHQNLPSNTSSTTVQPYLNKLQQSYSMSGLNQCTKHQNSLKDEDTTQYSDNPITSYLSDNDDIYDQKMSIISDSQNTPKQVSFSNFYVFYNLGVLECQDLSIILSKYFSAYGYKIYKYTTLIFRYQSSEMTTLLIDNYDSFTYNVYQYLCAQGADVVVYRNDKITIEEIEKLAPCNIVISPGPGHPAHDAGISRDTISHFAGKIPILGICMGMQCMFEVYGGTVSYAGDILHGKTSAIKHDSRGLFKGIPQNNLVTRYHSLAGMPSTIPDSLEVTATTIDDVIMGVRHKEYTVEGVQFHPESILCENGHVMMANFLKLRGGTWDENPGAGVLPSKLRETSLSRNNESKKSSVGTCSETMIGNTNTAPGGDVPSILTRIYAQRIKDVQAAKEVPGQTMKDLEKLLELHIAPPLRDVVSRLAQQTPSLLAEVKRASPSKGNIDAAANAAEQALQYALAGASVISVLTEPKWFRGTIHDMRQVREAISNLPNRPCVLRKDFIVDRYQIAEGRLYGADTILLIVAMLNDELLHDLYNYSKSLGMEPLVEVHNAEEMARANALGAKLIGVNNRNLHNFDVDMETTSRLAKMVPEGTMLCALSGITSRSDVEMYLKEGVQGVLVGEALMRAWNLKAFVTELLGLEKKDPVVASKEPNRSLVKVCGISTVEAAMEAANAGADLIGLIFAEKSKRKVSIETATEIVKAVHSIKPESTRKCMSSAASSTNWFQIHRHLLENRTRKPLVVGVFVNQTIEYMNYVVSEVGLDLVQLHGTESVELARYLPVPVIKACHIDNSTYNHNQIPNLTQPGNHHYVLLDAKVSNLPSDQQGGQGVKFDWSIAKDIVNHKQFEFLGNKDFPIILAGGLDPTNVVSAIQQVKPWMVDVSSGVETDGIKDLKKIRTFIEIVKSTEYKHE
ncbi:indole-3-glycerol phosphate synthase-domain-containing protein [Cokeromyces recurvatus]|uniref:indole-3-glycerol phosphate synthase-domain-containing protein n=1 Tax=Cokeromyces recurvatus TaxID=90255 RepID=UPI00222057B1|nr:indole-3-glycerol phosphate synthase-domain-containing protein [Cokeromyces recurvatus]KAI7908349.1 indole-3-glycerol phosphate synthase-domain-containing protein [Cokeromyces recurvatus]